MKKWDIDKKHYMQYSFIDKEVGSMVLEHNVKAKVCHENGFHSTAFEKEDFGKVSMKYKNAEGVHLVESNANFIRPTRIYDSIEDKSNTLFLSFNLGKEIEGNYEKKYILKNRSSNIWSFPDSKKNFINYNPNGRNHCFHILINGSYIEELANRYPDLLGEVYTGYQNKYFIKWNKNDVPITDEMQQIIMQIRNAGLMGRNSKAYIDAKVLELLVLQLSPFTINNISSESICKTTQDVEKIHEARSILLNNIENPPSIYELSKKVGINDFKLKKGFKEIFNQTVYGYLFDFKMQKAYKLLSETEKTIYEIAIDCGYEYPNHFSAAFKRKFGVNPSSLRKMK
jgi:AraC-like DNA-binding protein